jgi:bifunctional non-homologous end joining protein LigD
VSLDLYRKKRRLSETPEPPGGPAPRAADGGHGSAPRFVVQEHHARRLHWDMRLEMEGVLRSWAVPKGPSLTPGEKRLAILVEDHPLEYGEFEGVIPPGHYGAGTVTIWDRGTYRCLEGDPAEAFRRGKLTVVFHGDRLRGTFHLIRTRRDGGRSWLLVKGGDGDEEGGTAPGPEGVRPGKEERSVPRRRPPVASSRRGPGPASPGKGKDPFPEPFRPMLAQSAPMPFSRPGWLFEVKWDGVRALAFVRRRGKTLSTELYSRTLRRVSGQFPEVVHALAGLDVESVVLDGEIIAPDEQGRPSFALLQQRLHRAEGRLSEDLPGVAYAVFDCLYLDGHDLRARPLAERRRSLSQLALPPGIVLSEAVEEDGLGLYEAVRRRGLEGIVAKDASSPYRPGVRSQDWQKVKVRETTEAVVAGFTRGRGHRTGTFGALVLGQYDPRTGVLVHIGQTGGGFADDDLRLLRARLLPLVTPACPFAVRPPGLAYVTWVRPEVVVEVAHGGRTPAGALRFPVFLRVRDDKPPREATLEGPEKAGGGGAGEGPARLGPGTPASGSRAPGRGRGRFPPPGLEFTHLDKVFFPERGYTKADVIEYYRKIAPYILPHLKDRPLTLRRFPDGIGGKDFFQKDVPDAPAFVRTERVWSDQAGRDITVPVGADDGVLAWLAQLGCIEVHAWFSRVTPRRGVPAGRMFSGSEEAIAQSPLNYPDFVVFDLDPFIEPDRGRDGDPAYSPRGFEAARRAAVWLGELLEDLGLRSFVKVSGKTGIHVFVPIARRYTFAQTHAFAKTMAAWLVQQHPDALTDAWAVRDRLGKVFIDYNQNVRGKTLACVYSLRPVPEATVSVPVTWEELRAGLDPLQWTITTVFDRLARVGDVWKDILKVPQRLERLRAPTSR